jgi:hypothetical protein
VKREITTDNRGKVSLAWASKRFHRYQAEELPEAASVTLPAGAIVLIPVPPPEHPGRTGQSVRAVSGGLPTLGRGHR